MADNTTKPPALKRIPAVQKPTVDQLKTLSEKLGLQTTDDELKEYSDVMETYCEVYQSVNDLPTPHLPTKYPRTYGRAPTKEENLYNAWCWKVEIKGAPEGILKGKTVAIKDEICISGVPMRSGSQMIDHFVPPEDTTCVTRVLDAGGRIIGKTTQEEYGLSASSFTSARGPVSNPYDPTRSAGGSSTGNAVLLAKKEVDIALGMDAGGSVRIPASLCGVVSIKPSYGLVPNTGHHNGCDNSICYTGPMTQTVRDCAIALQAIAGYDGGLDPTQSPSLQVPDYVSMLGTDLQDFKIGILKEGFVGRDQDVDDLVREAAMKLKTVGAIVEDVSIPMHEEGENIWLPMMFECDDNLGHRGYYAIENRETVLDGFHSRSNTLDTFAKVMILWANYQKTYYRMKYYMKSKNWQIELQHAYDKVLEKYDVLVMPTMHYRPPKLPTVESSVAEVCELGMMWGNNCCAFNVTGHPALTINVGFTDGLPCGMQIVAKINDDAACLRVGHIVEKIRDQTMERH
ncbi:unnamed protein product [Owenia fusiformis]|uniref:Uncharacterized protein n=1 Tax=Owenia fusiformis TaxID=6347 RepID=A0A8J1XV24_OWEFU|nr:unnamed protein product [Owenia fusiformis]